MTTDNKLTAARIRLENLKTSGASQQAIAKQKAKITALKAQSEDATGETWPAWAPGELKEQCVGMKARDASQGWLEFMKKIATDPRMCEFWEWYRSLPAPYHTHSPTSPTSICWFARRAVDLPMKPGDMTRREREKYFESTRKHANALIELISGTWFDWKAYMSPKERLCELNEATLAAPLESGLPGCLLFPPDIFPGPRGEEVIAFAVKTDQNEKIKIYSLPPEYPDISLIEILRSLVQWTYQTDRWGPARTSSAPLTQAHHDNARVVFFTRTVYAELKQCSPAIEIPMRMLAILANVALDLPPDQEVDADTVKKQVQRYDKNKQQSYLDFLDEQYFKHGGQT